MESPKSDFKLFGRLDQKFFKDRYSNIFIFRKSNFILGIYRKVIVSQKLWAKITDPNKCIVIM